MVSEKIYFCLEKNGFEFVDSSDAENVPETYQLVTREYYDLFFHAQASPSFKILAQDNDVPLIREMSNEEIDSIRLENLAVQERAWRDNVLPLVDYQINTLEDYGRDASHLRAYRVALRNYPQQPDFPNGERPTLNEGAA